MTAISAGAGSSARARIGITGWCCAQALEFARADPRIPYITFLLPPSRRRLGALRRMGAEQVGEVQIDGATFLKFRLETEAVPATGSATG